MNDQKVRHYRYTVSLTSEEHGKLALLAGYHRMPKAKLIRSLLNEAFCDIKPQLSKPETEAQAEERVH